VAAFESTPCTGPSATESQGEAIAVTSDGSAYLTASEVLGAIDRGDLPAGAPAEITRVAIDPPAVPATEPPATAPPDTEPPLTGPDTTGPDTTAPDTTAPDTTGPVTTAPTEESRNPSGLALALPLVGGLVIGLALLVRRRRAGPSSV
jgi:hypothetical protein